MNMKQLLKKEWSFLLYLSFFVIIKLIYDYLTLNSLASLWYPGIGNYQININYSKNLLCFIALFLMSFVAYGRGGIKSDFKRTFITILFVLYYIPINSSYALQDRPISYFVLTNVFFLEIVFFMKIKISNGKLLLYESKKNNFTEDYLEDVYFDNSISIVTTRLYYICIIISLIYILFKLSYNGLSVSFSFAIENVYGVRDDYMTYLNGIGGTFIAYPLSIIRYCAPYSAIIVFYYSLRRHRPLGITIGLLTFISIFSVESSKGTLLFIFIVIFVYYCFKKRWLAYFDKVFVVSAVLLLIVSLVEWYVRSSSIIYSLIIRREMFIPSWLNYLYYEYFDTHGPVMLTDNVFLLQKLLPHVYSSSPLQLISNAYFAGQSSSPNTGLFGEAYMQMGFVGAFVFPFIIVIIVNFISKQFGKCDSGIQMLIAVRIAMSITNVPILRTSFVLSIVLISFIIVILERVNIKRRI